VAVVRREHYSASIDNADISAGKLKFNVKSGPENWHVSGIFPKMGVQHLGFRAKRNRQGIGDTRVVAGSMPPQIFVTDH
jgi:hypothetical protein